MLKITLAEVTPGNTVVTNMVPTSTVAEVHAAQAAMRPLAGFGAGAFTCDGAGVGSSASQLAAGLALPRVRGAFGAVQHSTAGTGTLSTGALSISAVSTKDGNAKQLNQMTRIYPVAPGGLGPHPAREPDPV